MRSSTKRTISSVAALAFAVVAPLRAQGVLLEINGSLDAECLGSTVAFVGDIDADGVEDFASGAPRADDVGVEAGRATIYSGATGAALYVYDGSVVDELFGSAIAGLGDLNGDGHGDFAISSPWYPSFSTRTGRVFVRSGIDGSLLYQLDGIKLNDQYGTEIASLGDVTGDGIPDFVVSALRAESNLQFELGAVYVHSGADGALLTTRFGTNVQGEFGRSIAPAGDVNGDGFPDFAVGAARFHSGGKTVGKVEMHTLASPTPLWSVLGAPSMHDLGETAAYVGDANQDGVGDIVVGAFMADNANFGDVGLAVVMAGGNGATLRSVYGPMPGDRLGSSVGTAGDVDGDGFDDFLAGAVGSDVLASNGGQVRAISSATGATLSQIDGTWQDGNLGNDISGGRDLNGDGLADVVIGAPFTAQLIFKGGSVYVESFACGEATAHGHTCPGWLGFLPQLGATGCFTPMGTFTLSVTAGLGGSTCVLLAGAAPAALPLPNNGCFLNVAPPIFFAAALPLSGVGPGNGSFVATAQAPLATGVGTVEMQAFVIDPNVPGGYSATTGLALRFE